MEGILVTFAQIFGLMLILKVFPRPLQRAKFAWRHLAERRTLCIVLAGVVPVVLHLAFFPRPEPAMHDEFAYLLQADTFAHGRLANPPRPLWEHFEQFHVLSQPVFAAKYQPLPAVFLAAGEIAGSPYYGVLLSAAVTFAAALWMLYGWLPPSYALFGWVIAMARWGPATYWMNSYWGGLVPALGGVLVIGAWPRLRKQITVRDSVLMGLGFVVLAASRPYEGFVLSLAAVVTLLIANRGSANPNAWRWIAYAAPVVAVGGAMMLYYDFKVTGRALDLPYFAHDRQYMAVSNFVFVPPKEHPPSYRHPEFARLYRDWFAKDDREYHAHPWRSQAEKLGSLWTFYCGGWPLSLGLVCAPLAWKGRLRWVLIMLAIWMAGLGLLAEFLPHYAAPAAGLILLAQVAGLHWLRYWNPQGKPTGSLLARVAVLAIPLLFVTALIRKPEGYTTGDASFKALRQHLIAQLTAEPGKHLVLVRYAPNHNPYMDFVVNGAGLDHESILWARAMSQPSDEELIERFRDRHIWTLDGDAISPELKCVSGCATNAQAAATKAPVQ